jgi:hypothetical protein
MCLPVKPFAIEKEWEFVGLKCAVVLNREHEHRCGYVRVSPNHPEHGKDYNDVDVDVHGGLTFGGIEPCEHEDGQGFWFGFDCAHCDDMEYEPGFIPDRLKDLYEKYSSIHGEHYWTLDEVVVETEKLAQQLASR